MREEYFLQNVAKLQDWPCKYFGGWKQKALLASKNQVWALCSQQDALKRTAYSSMFDGCHFSLLSFLENVLYAVLEVQNKMHV